MPPQGPRLQLPQLWGRGWTIVPPACERRSLLTRISHGEPLRREIRSENHTQPGSRGIGGKAYRRSLNQVCNNKSIIMHSFNYYYFFAVWGYQKQAYLAIPLCAAGAFFYKRESSNTEMIHASPSSTPFCCTEIGDKIAVRANECIYILISHLE